MAIKFGTKTASNTGPANTPSVQQDPDSILVLLGQNSTKTTDLIKQIVNKIDFQSIIASVQEIQKSVVSIQPFIEDSWANIGDMFDKLKEIQSSTIDTAVSGTEGTIRFIIECADGESYTAIREILDIAKGDYDDDSFETINELINVFKYIERISKEIGKLDLSEIDKTTVKSMHNMYLVIEELKNIAQVSSRSLKYILPVILFSDQLIKFPGIFVDLIGTKQKDRGIARLYDRLSRTKLDMKIISAFMDDLSEILKSSIIVGLMAIIANKSVKYIPPVIEKLNEIIDIINSSNIKKQKSNNSKNLKIINDNLRNIKDILISAALLAPLSILAIPGILSMNLVFKLLAKTQTDNIKSVSRITKDERKIKKDQTNFMSIVGASALILLGAALFGGFIARHVDNIGAFTLILSGFIILMSGVALLSKILLGLSKTSTKGSKRKSSILSKIIGKTNNEDSYNSIFDDLSGLVLSAAATLVIGSVIIAFLNIGNILLFSGLLIGFIFLISIAVFGAKKLVGGDGMVAFTGLGSLILLSTIALGIGALFIKAGLALPVLIFAGILILTIGGISIAVALASKIAGKRGLMAVKGLTVFIIAITAALLIGGLVVSDEERKKAIIDFAAISILFVSAMSVLMFILGKINKSTIIQGILALTAITIIAILMSVVMKNFAEATAILPQTFKNKTVDSDGSKSKTKMGNSLWTVLGGAGAIIVGLAGLAIGLGALTGTGIGGGVLWLGIAALGAIVGIALMVSEAIKNFAEGYQIMVTVASSLDKPEETMKTLKNLMSNFTTFVGEFAELSTKIKPRKVKRTADAFGAVVEVVGGAASVIKNVADLSIPIYNEKGEIIGYKEIKEPEFNRAIDNTGKIMTVLGNALIEIYQNGTGVGIGKDLFRNTATLSLITAGILNIVKIVGDSSAIIKDLADFKYTYIDENGKEHKLSIDDTVLEKAKENIISVVTCMSNALVDLYSKDNLAFKDNSILRKAKKVNNDVFNVISLSIDSMNSIIDLFSKEGADKAGDKYKNMLDAIINPFTKNTLNDDQIDLFEELSEIDFTNTSKLVNSINRVDVSKTDKFIELSNKLIELNKNMGNLDSFISAFDEKITMTLGELADRIELASKTIKESDKSQEKRQKKIEENRKKLKEMLLTPVKVEVSNDNTNKTTNNPLFNNIKPLENNKLQNPALKPDGQNKNENKLTNDQNNMQDNMGNAAAKLLDNIDSTMVNMAGTTSDIYTLLQQYLEK